MYYLSGGLGMPVQMNGSKFNLHLKNPCYKFIPPTCRTKGLSTLTFLFFFFFQNTPDSTLRMTFLGIIGLWI